MTKLQSRNLKQNFEIVNFCVDFLHWDIVEFEHRGVVISYNQIEEI